MQLDGLAFDLVDWESLPLEEHAGAAGTARWRTRATGSLRVRLVEYSPGYEADHWCSKGHVVYCVRGEFASHHQDGTIHMVATGMSYVVGDDVMPHRSTSKGGATLFIVD